MDIGTLPVGIHWSIAKVNQIRGTFPMQISHRLGQMREARDYRTSYLLLSRFEVTVAHGQQIVEFLLGGGAGHGL